MTPVLHTEEERERMREQKRAHPLLEARDPDTELVKGKKTSGYALAGRNARLLLKQAYPHTRFQVTTQAYSGGSSMYVRWDAWDAEPTVGDIRKLLDVFMYGETDPHTDDYVVDTDEDRRAFRAVFGRVKIVAPERRVPTDEERARRDASELDGVLPLPATRSKRARM